jgi:hypothetical protein
MANRAGTMVLRKPPAAESKSHDFLQLTRHFKENTRERPTAYGRSSLASCVAVWLSEKIGALADGPRVFLSSILLTPLNRNEYSPDSRGRGFGTMPALSSRVQRIYLMRGGPVKVQNMIRMQVAIIGFGAALFFASAAPAQEITNTEWPDRPGATEPMNRASLGANAASNSGAVEVKDSEGPASRPVLTERAPVSQAPAEGGWITTLVVLCVAGATAYSLAARRRTDRGSYVPAEHLAKSISLS